MCSPDLFLAYLAILFPPLPVWVKTGICSADSIINILLCLLGLLPGLLHAWYIIYKYPETYEYDSVPQDSERGPGSHVTYVFVQEPQPQPRPQAQPKTASGSYPSYGATNTNTNNPRSSPSSAAGPSEAPHHDHDHDHEGRAPPTYAEAVKGDHKIQTQD
ncbi:uncharacterized protein F4812DRAFT_418556 [Daldinia caldariorum]|uniref:uncharacterized protein n=1 Tax=Daldinia caldariorum TaxID=326644 RepID=UPI00200796EC|nr:uncharacterized protein F4812DRAFT_418556 [Daldinia caldariorum]KAI1470664.1 hypothetical protein F4812DRAFT_418556 [Daldinia caldariorum]